VAADKLKTEIRVQAWLRRCAGLGLMATVARRGDGDAGALFLKVNHFAGGCEVFSGVSTSTGTAGWHRATGAKPVPEKEADAYLARQVRYDADLWIVEIEDPKGQFVLGEPIFEF
jgi:GMP synthase (glutamine-hydrolysing)